VESRALFAAGLIGLGLCGASGFAGAAEASPAERTVVVRVLDASSRTLAGAMVSLSVQDADDEWRDTAPRETDSLGAALFTVRQSAVAVHVLASCVLDTRTLAGSAARSLAADPGPVDLEVTIGVPDGATACGNSRPRRLPRVTRPGWPLPPNLPGTRCDPIPCAPQRVRFTPDAA
jgi:hypothetical protein